MLPLLLLLSLSLSLVALSLLSYTRALSFSSGSLPMPSCHPRERIKCIRNTANLRTKILDFGGLDSIRILSSRGGILMSIGGFPESLSQAILVGIILLGRLGVIREWGCVGVVATSLYPRHIAVGSTVKDELPWLWKAWYYIPIYIPDPTHLLCTLLLLLLLHSLLLILSFLLHININNNNTIIIIMIIIILIIIINSNVQMNMYTQMRNACTWHRKYTR